MNRLAFGAGVLVLAPILSGCGNFYLTQPPLPAATATPAPTAIAYPFDPTQGTQVLTATGGQGIAQNSQTGTAGLPTAFRVADVNDIQPSVGRANDPANAILLMVLQPVNTVTATTTVTTNRGAVGATPVAAPATAVLVGGVKDVNHPVHLAGIIVPGPSGRVGAGLQDADEQALQAQASSSMTLAVSNWVRLTGTYAETTVAGATATPIPTPTPRPRRGVVARATPIPTPPPLVDPKQLLDVYQDPQFPVDSENRPLVQIFFKSNASKTIAAGTQLSLNRMLVRSGWAVVDLYSPTSFDQKTWLLDEAYARNRHLGIWGLELNGKKLTLQQRVPSQSTGTGARSHVAVTTNMPPRPGTPIRPMAPVTSATQSPATLTPTLAPQSIPRVVPNSGTTVHIGPLRGGVLPPPAAGAAPATSTATAGGLPGSSGNGAAP